MSAALTRSLIGWFCSILRGISRAVLALGGFCPMVWKAIFAAAMYASRESTIVPSKSKKMPFALSLALLMLLGLCLVLCCLAVCFINFSRCACGLMCSEQSIAPLFKGGSVE